MKRIGDEHELLVDTISVHRSMILWKLDGLTEGQARTGLVGSAATLLGIINHLAHVERWWVHAVIAGSTSPVPPSDTETDADWIAAEHETIASVTAFFEEVARKSDEILDRETNLERVVQVGSREMSVRWILLNLIGEIGRHAGHADIIRESIDAAAGFVPPSAP